jgi:hypothetical protein
MNRYGLQQLVWVWRLAGIEHMISIQQVIMASQHGVLVNVCTLPTPLCSVLSTPNHVSLPAPLLLLDLNMQARRRVYRAILPAYQAGNNPHQQQQQQSAATGSRGRKRKAASAQPQTTTATAAAAAAAGDAVGRASKVAKGVGTSSSTAAAAATAATAAKVCIEPVRK